MVKYFSNGDRSLESSFLNGKHLYIIFLSITPVCHTGTSCEYLCPSNTGIRKRNRIGVTRISHDIRCNITRSNCAKTVWLLFSNCTGEGNNAMNANCISSHKTSHGFTEYVETGTTCSRSSS